MTGNNVRILTSYQEIDLLPKNETGTM